MFCIENENSEKDPKSRHQVVCLKIYFCNFKLVTVKNKVKNKVEYEPKQRSVSNECIGNSSLSPDETLHSIGLKYCDFVEIFEPSMFSISNSMKTHVT